MAKITEIEVKSVGEIITYLSEHGNANDLTLYRGQKKDWSLEPKVSRIKLRGNEDIVESEKKMYYDFEFYSKPYFNKDGLFSLDILSVAQHHGMATRFAIREINVNCEKKYNEIGNNPINSNKFKLK